MGKVRHGAGIVLQQALVGGQIKRSAVHLRAAGIQCTEHRALAGVGRRQCFQRGNRRAQCLPGEGQAFDSGQTDAQAGKAAGAGVHAIQVDVGAGHAAGFQAGVDHRHQRLAVGHARVQIDLVQQAVILQQGHARRLSGGVHGQNVHTSTPSMVILRVFSSTRSMFTWIGCSSASRSAKFSLHSAATMAP